MIRRHGLPWHVTRLGRRVEYHFAPDRPRNGSEAAAQADFELERFIHLFALDRGVLLFPFFNKGLLCPAHSEADVDRHTEVLDAAVSLLLQ